MTLKAVAWDIDGTLVDSEPLHHEALVAACARWGVDLSGLPDMAFRGVHVRDVWTILSPRLPQNLAFADWLSAINRYYAAHPERLIEIPGALAAFDRLAALGAAQVCVSNSSREIVAANLSALGIADRIAFSISLDDVAEGKPDPEPYLQACRRLSIAPGNVAAIEDSVSGARSARAAGLRVVGYNLRETHGRDVDIFIDDFDHLPELITRRSPLVASRQIAERGD